MIKRRYYIENITNDKYWNEETQNFGTIDEATKYYDKHTAETMINNLLPLVESDVKCVVVEAFYRVEY